MADCCSEGGDDRLRRIRLRSRQRGLKETCVILGDFAETCLTVEETALLDAFEALLQWPDQDILTWILELEPPPVNLAKTITLIRTSQIQSHRFG